VPRGPGEVEEPPGCGIKPGKPLVYFSEPGAGPQALLRGSCTCGVVTWRQGWLRGVARGGGVRVSQAADESSPPSADAWKRSADRHGGKA